MEEPILFIINPISGSGRGAELAQLIESRIDRRRYSPQIALTTARGHATELAREAVAQGLPYVVAVGGDGTVNEVGRALVGSPTALGIVPHGSGNGFARHLGLPTGSPQRAIEMLNSAHVEAVDYGTLNGRPFLCTAGTGFDAVMGDRFVHLPRRGFAAYAHAVIAGYWGYRPLRCRLQLDDGRELEQEVFLLALANAAQWGYGVRIAPEANVSDGLLDITMVARFPKWRTLGMALRLFAGRIGSSRYVTTLRARRVRIARPVPDAVHVDGEPFDMEAMLEAECHPGALRVLIP